MSARCDHAQDFETKESCLTVSSFFLIRTAREEVVSQACCRLARRSFQGRRYAKATARRVQSPHRALCSQARLLALRASLPRLPNKKSPIDVTAATNLTSPFSCAPSSSLLGNLYDGHTLEPSSKTTARLTSRESAAERKNRRPAKVWFLQAMHPVGLQPPNSWLF